MAFLEKYQVGFYLLALVAGGVASFLPGVARAADPLLNPALGLLLLATFLSLPLGRQTSAQLPQGFTAGLLLLNFLVVPVIAIVLLALAPVPDTIAYAAALVLLAPCIDYVVVFAGLAGGSASRLLAATPLLLVAQIVLVPLWLYLAGLLGIWEEAPVSIQALSRGWLPALTSLLVVLLPLAWCLQRGRRTTAVAQELAETSMVPLMLAILALSTAAHTGKVAGDWGVLIPLIPVYTVFALLAGAAAWLLSRPLLRPSLPADRVALTFSAVTRNALVVLPLVLGVSLLASQAGVEAADLMLLAVVTQTMVELPLMVLLVTIFRAVKNWASQEASGLI